MQAEFEAVLQRTWWDWQVRLIYADWLEDHGQPDAALEQRLIAWEKRRRVAKGPPRDRQDYDTTHSSAVYRKLRKRRLAGCDRCPWHRGDNIGRRARHSSWKKSRRQQWRAK